jgi:hypothetical protein
VFLPEQTVHQLIKLLRHHGFDQAPPRRGGIKADKATK